MLAVMQSLTCNLVLKQTINQQLKAFLRAPSAAAEISVLCSILPSFLPLWVFLDTFHNRPFIHLILQAFLFFSFS